MSSASSPPPELLALSELLGHPLPELAARLCRTEESLGAEFRRLLKVSSSLDDALRRLQGDVEAPGCPPQLFALRGPEGALALAHLPQLSAHLTQARQRTLYDSGALERLSLRLSFGAQPVAGPQPRHAALQGHRLARRVRAQLDLGMEPLGDLGALLSGRLGVHVVVEPKLPARLGACAARAPGVAVVVLAGSAGHPPLRADLMRVMLAHELCHILFDAGDPTALALSVDSRSERQTGGGRGDLHESRARGFAAELLLPGAGVHALLGAPAQVEAAAARPLVRRARAHFGASWALTVNHLHNLGYLSALAREELEFTPAAPLQAAPSTSLSPAHPGPADALALAGPARQLAEQAAQQLAVADEAAAQALLQEVLACAQAGDVGGAADRLAGGIDTLLLSGQLRRLQRLLDTLPLAHLPAQAITGALMVARGAQDALGPAWTDLRLRAQAALIQHHGWTPERALASVRRLA